MRRRRRPRGQRAGAGHGAPPASRRGCRLGRCGRCARAGDCARTSLRHTVANRGGACMIGKLAGTVDSLGEDHAIIDVNGVGYLVSCPSSTLSRLSVGAPANLMVETRVSEDAIRLYGFAAAEEREWFRLLQTVQNVGARVRSEERRVGKGKRWRGP